MDDLTRCGWATRDDDERDYHDTEWGVPVSDDNAWFEAITLEGAQAGLSWRTILKKREGYRRAFARFDPTAVAEFDQADVERLVHDASIVRHRGKIESTINNARQILEIKASHGSFDAFIRDFFDHRRINNSWREMSEVPGQTEASDRLSKALKKLGFRFVGSTTCYAMMQATGLVNDHLVTCFRHRTVGELD